MGETAAPKQGDVLIFNGGGRAIAGIGRDILPGRRRGNAGRRRRGRCVGGDPGPRPSRCQLRKGVRAAAALEACTAAC